MDDRRYESWRLEIEQALADGGPEAALDRVRETLAAEDDPRVQLREGILLSRLGRWSEAAAVLEPLEPVREALGMPEELMWLLTLAQALVNSGRPTEASPWAREASEIPAIADQGRLLLAQVARVTGDAETEEALLSTGAESDDPELVAAEAIRRWRGGRRAEAEDLARRAADLDPERPEALGVLGLAALGRGELETALRSLGTAMALQPGEAAWARGMAEAAARSGDRDGALAILRHALDHHPEGDGRAQILHALAVLAAGDPESEP